MKTGAGSAAAPEERWTGSGQEAEEGDNEKQHFLPPSDQRLTQVILYCVNVCSVL